MTEKKEHFKPPYNIERRSFDPEILNITIENLKESIDDLNMNTNQKFKNIYDTMKNIQNEIKNSNKEQFRLDKEFAIFKAGHEASDKSKSETNKNRTNLLFQILAIISAFGALFVSFYAYFKKGAH